MRNVQFAEKNGILTISVDIKKDLGLSHSGKSHVVASTDGNQNVDGVMVGLNVYRPNKPSKAK